MTSARNSSRDSFIFPTAQDHNTNVDPLYNHLFPSTSHNPSITDNTHSKASPCLSPSTSTSTPDSQTINAPQLALPNSGFMSDRGNSKLPSFTPSGLSLLLARKRSASKDIVGSETSTPSRSNLLSTEQSQSSSDRTVQTHVAPPCNRSSPTGSQSYAHADACRQDTPGAVDERLPLLPRPRSSPREHAITHGSGPGLGPQKKSTVRGFLKKLRHHRISFEPMGLVMLAKTAIPAVILGALLNVLDGLSCK